MLKFNSILRRRSQEEGSSMIFAILVMMVMLLATILVTSYAVTAAVTANKLGSRDVYRSSALAGIQNAMLSANNNGTYSDVLERHRGSANAVTGNYDSSASNRSDAVKWAWYTERVVLSGQRVGYYVYSTGWSDQDGQDKGVKLRAQFDPVLVTGGKWIAASDKETNGHVSYSISYDSPYQLGLTGLNEVTVEGSAKFYSSDSYYGNQPSGTTSNKTSIAANSLDSTGKQSTINISATTSGLQQKSFTAPVNGISPCTGAGCDISGTTYRNYDLNLNDVTAIVNGGTLGNGNTVAGKCTNPAGIWRASEHAGVMDIPGDSCVQQIIFDVNTTVPATYSTNTPLKIYSATGVNVYKGVSVNSTNSPAALRITSATGDVNVGDPNNVYGASNTYFGGYITTAQGRCQVNTATTYFGAMACNRVNLLTGATFYQDLASYSVNTNVTQRNVWSQAYLEEL